VLATQVNEVERLEETLISEIHWVTGQTHSHHRSGDENVFARLPKEISLAQAF